MEANDFVEVYVVGELNIYKAIENRKVFLTYLKNNKNILLDLSNVTEFDTTGLQLLISLQKSLKKNNKNLFLRRCSEVVKNILSLLRLEKKFDMVD
jgi:anti-anti-sigma factor